MTKKNILIVFYLILTILSKEPNITKINTNYKEINSTYNYLKIDENPIGKIIIPKINLEKNLYTIESKNNNIEKNVTILKGSTYPNTNNSLTVIAAHSGFGKKAYFKDLDKLNIQDEIIIIYNEKNYTYTVEKVWEEKKTGYLNLTKEFYPQLILTTCSQKNKDNQLIIKSKLKES